MHKPWQWARGGSFVRLVAGLALTVGAFSCATSEHKLPLGDEYVLVQLQASETGAAVNEQRQVLIDSKPTGRETGELIQFEGGPCEITLDRPDDYVPASHNVTVQGTTVLTPLKVVFRRKA